MQLSYAAIVATLVTFACAQSVADLVQQLPSCALVCLATGAAAGGCGITDFACQCGAARSVITASAAPCIEKSCTGGEPAKAISITNQICAASGGSKSPSTTATGKPAVVTQIGDGQIQAPVDTPASSFASFAPTYAPTKATTTAPAQYTGNSGSKVNAGVLMAGAAMLAAFAL